MSNQRILVPRSGRYDSKPQHLIAPIGKQILVNGCLLVFDQLQVIVRFEDSHAAQGTMCSLHGRNKKHCAHGCKMLGLHNISQLYQKFFDPPGEMPIEDLISILKDSTNPDFSTADAEPTKEPSPSEPMPEPQLKSDLADPCDSFEQAIALASVDQIPSLPLISGSPSARLHTLIRADRYPPGERAHFAAIDALGPELGHHDAVIGLKMALKLLQNALERALDDPTVIQQHQHVRNKLMTEYLGLPHKVQVEGGSMDMLLEGVKGRVASRWRVEAMEKQ